MNKYNKKSLLKNNRGFTFMEIIIVIILLGAIIIIFSSKMGDTFFSNRDKSLAYNTIDDLRVIEDAAKSYLVASGSEAADINTLVSSGELHKLPVPIRETTVSAQNYIWHPNWFADYGQVGVVDTVVYLTDVKKNVCVEVNRKVTGNPSIPTGPDYSKNLLCWGSDPYIITKLIHTH